MVTRPKSSGIVVATALVSLAIGLMGPAAATPVEPPPVDPAPVVQPMTVKAKFPKSAKLGGGAKITGQTSQPSAHVVLELRTRNGAVRLASARAKKNGQFVIKAPTNWVGKRKVRIAATTATHEGSVKGSYTVKSKHRALGKSKHHKLFGWRHNPCQTLTYKVRTKHLPKGAMKDIHTAFRMISEATGMKFRYDGRSKDIPWGKKSKLARGYGKANFLVGYATPTEVPLLMPPVGGVGGAVGYDQQPKDSLGIAVESHVALNTQWAKRLPKGFNGGYSRGFLILHELGHAVGLEHAHKPHQVMGYNNSLVKHARLGKGDLAGLRKIGLDRGCVDSAEYDEAVEAWRP